MLEQLITHQIVALKMLLSNMNCTQIQSECRSGEVIPPPTDDSGWVMVEQNIEPKWCDGDVFPPQMADILETLDGDQSTKLNTDDGTSESDEDNVLYSEDDSDSD